MKNYVSQEQKDRAKDVNLIDFLESEFPEYIAYSSKTNEYIHPDHDSLKIYEKGFYRFSNGGKDRGDNIRYLREWCGVQTFQEAVLMLCQFDGVGIGSNIQIKNVVRKPKIKASNDKPMPKKASRNTEILRYLITERGIERDTVDMLINQGVIYQDTKNNVVFINEKTDFALLRGTGEKWQNVWKPGNGYWCFSAGDNPTEVFITEAPIDAISLYLLRNKAPGVYCAMGGIKINTVARIIDDYPGCSIKIAPDWDEKGKSFVKDCFKLKKNIIYIHPKAERISAAGGCKDWNELLLLEQRKREI